MVVHVSFRYFIAGTVRGMSSVNCSLMKITGVYSMKYFYGSVMEAAIIALH